MDPTRDNPIIRFVTFWWGLGLFLLFAVLLGGIGWLNRATPESLEELAAKVRYAHKAKTAQAQRDELPPERIRAAIPAVAERLAASRPAAVEKPEQVVPGTPTAEQLAPPAKPAGNAPPASGAPTNATPNPGTPAPPAADSPAPEAAAPERPGAP